MIARRPLLVSALGALGCASASARVRVVPGATEVLVMGTIHGAHLRSDRYGLRRVREIVERINPDVVLAEIPPDRFEAAMKDFRRDGTVREPRVRSFPEYGGAVFPLAAELGFEIAFGAWHKHWFLDRLRERTDLTIRDVAGFL